MNRRWNNCVFEITKKKKGEIILASTLNDAAEILKVDFITVRRHLDSSSGQQDGFAIIKGNKIIRVAVFFFVNYIKNKGKIEELRGQV